MKLRVTQSPKPSSTRLNCYRPKRQSIAPNSSGGERQFCDSSNRTLTHSFFRHCSLSPSSSFALSSSVNLRRSCFSPTAPLHYSYNDSASLLLYFYSAPTLLPHCCLDGLMSRSFRLRFAIVCSWARSYSFPSFRSTALLPRSHTHS